MSLKEIPSLYETAVLGWSEQEIQREGHKAHPNIKAYHHYINKFTDKSGEYYVRLTVNEEKARQGKAGKNLVHSAAISNIAIYKKDDVPQRIRVIDPGEAAPSPFIDIKLQQFFNSVNPSEVSQALTEATRKALVDKHGEKAIIQFVKDLDLYGGNYKALTEQEAGYILKETTGERGVSLNALRDSSLAERTPETRRILQEGVHGQTPLNKPANYIDPSDIAIALDENGEPQVTRIDGEDYWVNTQTGQRKSATGNAGTFNGETGNIYHQTEDAETADNEGMREEQQREIAEKLETMAEPMDRREFTREEYNTLFPEGKVKTPLDTVKLGAHQFERLKERKREKLLGAMRQTLEDPVVILQEEREGKPAHIYIKSFLSNRKNKHTNVLTVVVDIKGEPIAVSTGERRTNQIDAKIKTASIPLYIKGGGSPTLGTGGTPPLPGISSISPGSPEKSSTSSPGGNNSSGQHSTGVKSFTDEDSVPALLFQLSQAHIKE